MCPHATGLPRLRPVFSRNWPSVFQVEAVGASRPLISSTRRLRADVMKNQSEAKTTEITQSGERMSSAAKGEPSQTEKALAEALRQRRAQIAAYI